MSNREKRIRCTKCGALNDADQFYCSECRFNLHMVYAGPAVEQKGPEPFTDEATADDQWRPEAASESDETSPASRRFEGRYRDAYSLTSILLSIGGFVKVVGVVLGVLLGLSTGSLKSGLLVFGGLLAAATVGLMIYLFGLLLAAQGQILRANLDSAVNSFPSLTETEKLRLMGL